MLVDQYDADVRAAEEALECRLDVFLSCFLLASPTVVHDEEVRLALVVAFSDAGEQETGHCVFVSDDRDERR